jgi:hypothetical protein
MATEFKGGKQRPRCEEEVAKSGRRLFEVLVSSAQEVFRRLWTPPSS